MSSSSGLGGLWDQLILKRVLHSSARCVNGFSTLLQVTSASALVLPESIGFGSKTEIFRTNGLKGKSGSEPSINEVLVLKQIKNR